MLKAGVHPSIAPLWLSKTSRGPALASQTVAFNHASKPPTKRIARQFRTQASSNAAASSSSLLDWVIAQGVDSNRVGVTVGTDGLVAARPIAKGETLCAIPESSWITKETALKSSIGQYLENLEGWVAIALFLLAERGNAASPWQAYFSSLPEEVGSPVAWSDADLELLQGTQLLAAVESYRAFFRQRFDQLQSELFSVHPAAFPADVFSYDAFLWAATTVRARTHAPLDGDDVALVPLADLTQHARNGGVSVKWSVKSAGIFKGGRTLAIEAERALKEGDKVAMDFAEGRTAGQVLLDYGVMRGSGSDVGSFALTVALPEDDRFFDDKIDILELAGLQASNEFVLASGSPPPEGLLPTLRLLNLQGGDAFLLEALFRNETWDHMQLPISEENELAVCKSMSEGCAAALVALASTAEEDAAALRAAAPGSRAAMAAAIRLGEREALEGASNWFGALIERLPNLEYYAERRLKRLGLLDKEGRPTDWESFFDEGIA